MVPIEKRLAAGDVNFGRVAGEDFERLSCIDNGLDGHQAALVGIAVVITELTSTIAFVREQQTRRAPKLELRLIPCHLAIIAILR